MGVVEAECAFALSACLLHSDDFIKFFRMGVYDGEGFISDNHTICMLYLT